MFKFKKNISIMALTTVLLTNNVHADCMEYCDCTTGCSYESSRLAACTIPAVAIGAAALGVMIALALKSSCSQHSHDCSN